MDSEILCKGRYDWILKRIILHNTRFPLVHLGVRGSWVYQSFMVSSGFLKNSGTLGWLRLLGVPEFYGFLWIFKNSGTLWRMKLLGVPEFSGFSRKSGRFFVEGRTSRGGGANNKKCHFLIFLISFLALAADKTPRMTSCQRILGA